MSIKGLVVSFEQDVTEEYADKLMASINLFQHIASVKAIEADYNDLIVKERVKREIGHKLVDFYKEYFV